MDKYNRIHHINKPALKQQDSHTPLNNKGSYNGKGVEKENGVSKNRYIFKADIYHHEKPRNNRQLLLLWKELRKYSPDLKKPRVRQGRPLANELKKLLSDPSINLGHLEKSLMKIKSSDNKIKEFLSIKRLRHYLKNHPKHSPKRLPPIFFEMLADNLETARLKPNKKIIVIEPAHNKKKKESLKENHKPIKKKSPTCSEPIKEKPTTHSHNHLFNLWYELRAYDSSLSYPIVMPGESEKEVIKKLLSSKKLTAGDLHKILNKIKNQDPWVKSFLEKDNIHATFALYKEQPVQLIATLLAQKISNHIELKRKENKPTRETYPLKEKRDNNDKARAHQKHNIKKEPNKSVLLESYENNKKNDNSKKIEFRKTFEQIKKHWENNRTQKNNTQPFTKIQAQSVDSEQLFTAELLNTVPDEVLESNGWSAEEIKALPLRRKTHTMLSEAAIDLKHKKALTTNSENRGRYFGEGSYGKVKFARITLPNAITPIWCVAKKILIKKESEYQKILLEIRLQNRSGVSVKIHGIANTTNKLKDCQSIIFMEAAKGKDGHSFLDAKHDFMSLTDKLILADNVLQKATKMHQRDVYHTDMKWANSTINNALSFTVLDFGLGSFDRRNYNPINYKKGAGYNAPELVAGKQNRLGYIDRAQVDVYNVGVMLGRLFGNKNFMRITWDSNTLLNSQHHIDKELLNVGITQPQIKQLIRRMVDANPDNRPSMQEALTQLNDIKQSEERKRLEKRQYHPTNHGDRHLRL